LIKKRGKEGFVLVRRGDFFVFDRQQKRDPFAAGTKSIKTATSGSLCE